jgi:hypothetical protein
VLPGVSFNIGGEGGVLGVRSFSSLLIFISIFKLYSTNNAVYSAKQCFEWLYGWTVGHEISLIHCIVVVHIKKCLFLADLTWVGIYYTLLLLRCNCCKQGGLWTTSSCLLFCLLVTGTRQHVFLFIIKLNNILSYISIIIELDRWMIEVNLIGIYM